MFKSKYTLWIIAFLIVTCFYNIFSIVQIEFNTVSLYSFKKFTIECGTIYDLLSNGQKRRINLAVNQAFAHLMTLSHGVCPSLVFLDEVTTNIDQIGVQGIYNMICELSKEKKVFVIWG